MIPFGSARERCSLKFYLVAMLFLLFDIEAVFLFPWAVVYRDLKLFGFLECLFSMLAFLAVKFYAGKKAAPDWDRYTLFSKKPKTKSNTPVWFSRGIRRQ